jgi:hypothetical protein
MPAHDRTIAFCRSITAETDPAELLAFCAGIQATDELLSTLPVNFYIGRGGSLANLVRAADAHRHDDGVEPFLATLKRCVQCEEGRGPEFVRLALQLAVEVAEELGDDRVTSYSEKQLDHRNRLLK